nr:RHS repeat-associated core domain-containing protein [uncultured Desulfuromonas sp.]
MCNLRFPGQYFDAESGLHYNWHRYYESRSERYITLDPIGLAGGINLYAYVQNDPVNWIDPNGLEAIAAPWGWVWDVGGTLGKCNPIGLATSIVLGMPSSTSTCSDYPQPDGCKDDDDGHCEKIYKTDTDTCNGISRVRGASAGAACHASATERYAACLRGKPLPPLNTWNN